MADNIITAVFGATRETKVRPRYRYDVGQVLVVRGVKNLPDFYEVHFSNEGSTADATPLIGTPDGVTIPDSYFQSGATIYAYIYIHNEATDGTTVYKVTIPIINRARPANVEPTPEEADIIAQAIEALNENVGKAEDAAEQSEASAERAEAAAAGVEAFTDRAEAAAQAAEAASEGVEEYAVRAESAAQNAQNAAQSAHEDAESAQNAAQNAQSAMRNAQDAALAAAGSESNASDFAAESLEHSEAALRSAEDATAANTAAQTAKTDAEAAAAAAAAAQTAAETAETHAGDSASQASTSAQSAADSAAEAERVLDSIPADYSEMSADVADLKSHLNDSNIAIFNGGVIFDYNVAPGYFNTSGTFVSQTANKEVYTKFAVSAGEQYRFAIKHKTVTNVVWLQMAYYDANDTFINRVTLTSTAVGEYECNLPIPEYVKYIAVMWREFDGADVFFTKVMNDTDAFNKIKGTSRNLFDADWYNARYNSSNGQFELLSNNTDAAVPPVIPVTGGNTYTITVGDFVATGGSLYIEEFANNSASRIKYTQVSDRIKSKTLTLDYNTAYLGIHHYISGNSNWRNLIPNYVQVEEGLSATQYVKHNIVSNDAIDALKLFTGNSDLLINIVNQSVIDTAYKIMPSLTVKSIAHRGDDIIAPQCTTPAYIAARKEGFTVAENDIWLSADNEFVMWHDNTLGKLGNMVDINGYLMYTDGTDFYYVQNGTVYEWSGTSYAASSKSLSSLTRCAGSNYSVTGITLADLKRIDFGVYKDAKYAGTQILTFTEWVLLCKQLGMMIYVDHKLTWTSDLLTEAANIVKKLGMGARSSWLSVGRTLIPQLRSIIPNARYGILANPTGQIISDYTEYLSTGEIFFDGDATALTQDAVELGLMAGFGVEAYYVDFGSTSETDVLNNIRAYVSYGLTGITLDHYKVEDAFQYLIS